MRNFNKLTKTDENEVKQWLQCDNIEIGYQLLNDDALIKEVINSVGLSSTLSNFHYKS